jgi:hypothetical protein
MTWAFRAFYINDEDGKGQCIHIGFLCMGHEKSGLGEEWVDDTSMSEGVSWDLGLV